MANFCSQCGAHLSGPYCSNCGAHAETLVAEAPATTIDTIATDPSAEQDLEHIRSLVGQAFQWFLWPFIFGRSLDLTALIMLGQIVNLAGAIGYAIGASANIALAYWLLYLARKGSPLARRAYCVLYGIWATVLLAISLVVVVTQPTSAFILDFIGMLAMSAGIAQSIRILTQIRPAVRRARKEGSVTTVSMKTEMPSFIATLLLLCLTVLQVSRELFRAQ